MLSGCDTGIGRIEDCEGVFGLRRAFRIAGARTLVMSLWPVMDETTHAWMSVFYRSRMERGESTPEAVRKAELSVLHQRRAAGLGTHPLYWGGFVSAGDWR